MESKSVNLPQTSNETKIADTVQTYINQLSDTETQIMLIAKNHLETSFCIQRSVGYNEWLLHRSASTPTCHI